MKCPNCSHEQKDGLFCSKCGARLDVAASTNVPPTHKPVQEEIIQQPKTVRKPTLTIPWTKKDAMHFLTVCGPLLISVIFLSSLLTFLLKGSVIIKDYTYYLFSDLFHLADRTIIPLIASLQIKFWDILLVFHGATYEGSLLIRDVQEPYHFQWKLPVIIGPIILISLVVIICKWLQKKRSLTRSQGWLTTVTTALVYALILMMIMVIMNPSYESSEAVLRLSTNAFAFFARAALFVFVGGVIGFDLWKIQFVQRTTVGKAISGLKPFLKWLSLLTVVLGFIMIVMWATLQKGYIFSKPLTTPASLWTLYGKDPLFYLLMPTFLIGELIYAYGGSFIVSSDEIGSLLQIPQAMSLNGWTGIKLFGSDVYDEQVARSIQSASRFTWYMFASLIIIIFSLWKIRAENIQRIALQSAFIGGLFAVLASMVTFTFESHFIVSGMIGFKALSSGFITFIVSMIVLLIKHVFQNKNMFRLKDGEQQ